MFRRGLKIKLALKYQKLISKEDKLSTKIEIRSLSTKPHTYGDFKVFLKIKE